METNSKKRIVAWVSLVLTGAVLVGAVHAADHEFVEGVAMALLSVFMIIVTIVLFAISSKTTTRAKATAEPISKETEVEDLKTLPTSGNKPKVGLKKAAKALYVFGSIPGAISIFMYVWAWYGYYISGEFAGSGGAAGIVFYMVLVVTVPATLIIMFFAIILHVASGQK